MLPAIHIKRTIDFNKNFRGLLEVLKLVAVAEYHNLEKKLKTFERMQNILTEFFGSLDLSQVQHPFLNPGDQPMAVVAVTSDTGLLGGLNNQVISKAVELVVQHNGRMIVIGERGLSYVQALGLSYVAYPGISDSQRYGQACEVRNFLVEKVLSGEYGAVKVIHARAHSFVVHRIETVTLVPFVAPDANPSAAVPAPPQDMIFECSPKEAVEYLVYLVIAQRLYEIFGMARVCEQAARYLHLEESCNKIGELNKKLLLQYFRRRHEVIDANMRELFSARSLYAK